PAYKFTANSYFSPRSFAKFTEVTGVTAGVHANVAVGGFDSGALSFSHRDAAASRHKEQRESSICASGYPPLPLPPEQRLLSSDTAAGRAPISSCPPPRRKRQPPTPRHATLPSHAGPAHSSHALAHAQPRCRRPGRFLLILVGPRRQSPRTAFCRRLRAPA